MNNSHILCPCFASSSISQTLSAVRWIFSLIGTALILSVSPLHGDSSFAAVDEEAQLHKEPKKKPYILVLYGPPGSGRAKLAIKLNQRFSVPKISFAELLAGALHEDSPIGKKAREYMQDGGDIPIDLFCMILEQRMKGNDCAQGCLWEGIPTTIEQTKMVIEKFSNLFNFLVFSINTPDEWLIQRVQGRLFCGSCGRVYHDPQSAPRREGVCDICGHSLQRRAEDSPETVRTRVQIYEQSMSPVLELWHREKLLINISGDRPIEEIFTEIVPIILQTQEAAIDVK